MARNAFVVCIAMAEALAPQRSAGEIEHLDSHDRGGALAAAVTICQRAA